MLLELINAETTLTSTMKIAGATAASASPESLDGSGESNRNPDFDSPMAHTALNGTTSYPCGAKVPRKFLTALA
jgi:hypothetical protein